ncbi:MAG: hypothetical protein ACI809_002797, partial [Candidatus Azotimanducaceae bacterium]
MDRADVADIVFEAINTDSILFFLGLLLCFFYRFFNPFGFCAIKPV